jgi:hypothetical protein
MRFYKYSYGPGESRQVAARGSFVRGISGSERYQLQIDDGPATEFETGLAFHPREPFASIRVTNTAAVTQIIEIAISEGQLDDNRLVGQMDVNGILSVVNSGGASWNQRSVTIAAGTASEILSNSIERISGTIQPADDMYIGADATVSETNGVLITGGQVVNIENTAALWGYSVAATTVQIMESIK